GRVLWNVNSTARGGGVAELLASLIPYDRDAGIDERWVVIEGSPDFFNVTNKIHTLLHGVDSDGAELTEEDRRQSEQATARNAACIEPFASKNEDLTGDTVTGILHAGGILQGRDGEATFKRHDGTRGHVVRTAHLEETALPYEARIVLQVSRWDRLKDPIGVMDGFAGHIAPSTDAWLVLAGPAATSVKDDPEQPEILDELTRRRHAMPPSVRTR